MDGLAVPPEWAPHAACVMAWPCRRALWGGQLAAAKADVAGAVAAVGRFEPVLLVARVGDGSEASAACPGAEVVEWPLDDSWTRDIGAIVATGDGRRAGVDPVFNGWGDKYVPYGEDARFAARMCAHFGLERLDASPFVLEGGAVTVDGAGSVVTTEECLLHPNRNPDLDRAGVERELRRWLGVDRVVWLPFGLIEDRDTDGHVDNVAMCVRPGVVVAQLASDPTDPNHDRLGRNADVLCEAGYEVVTVDVLPAAEVGGRRVVVPPVNLYLANGAAIVPLVEGEAGERAVDAVRSVLPDREVVGVPGATLAYGGGGVHCITQQVPVGP